VAIAAAGSPIDSGTFLADLAQCAEAEELSVAHAIRDLSGWLSLSPTRAARHVHESGLDPAHMERWRGISAFVTPSLLWSLYAFLRSPDDYWETICTAIWVGGDTDTMASMAGAISGARLGMEALPSGLLARLNDRGEWGSDALAQLAKSCAAIVETR
jgi:ADP-ribosylglycohydrolase